MLIMEKGKQTCENCRRELDLGVEAIKVNEGVIGMRGFVPLEKTVLLCGEKCLRDYYDLGDLPSVPARIP